MKLFGKSRKPVVERSLAEELDEIDRLQSEYKALQNNYRARLAPGSIVPGKIQAGTITASSINAGTFTQPKTLWVGITPAENGYLVKVEHTASPFSPQSYKTHVAATFEEVQSIIAANVVAQKLDDAG
jgi:hypothetical protein